MSNTGMPRCPRNCYDKDEYVYPWPSKDMETSLAYLCTACGSIFFINKRVIPRSEERQMWIDKYGDKNDI